uniref:Chemokine interleukin-8-like domain-containing protein n=1 Tax=Periophthalmus magnuspinnatus TaxID=409849 RepID=A0A3B3ZQM6_9GOBI
MCPLSNGLPHVHSLVSSHLFPPWCPLLCSVPCPLSLVSFLCSSHDIAMDCCLEVKNKVVPKEVVVHYFEQVGGQGCDIDATILVTRQGRNLCITPTQPKLNQIKKHVDKLKNHYSVQCSAYKPMSHDNSQ